MKGGANHRALTLLAAVNAELQGFQDGIVLGWVACICHASIVRAGDAGRQRSNVAKGGRGVWFLKRNKSEKGHVQRGQPPRRPSLIHRELAANREAARSSERTAHLLPSSPSPSNAPTRSVTGIACNNDPTTQRDRWHSGWHMQMSGTGANECRFRVTRSCRVFAYSDRWHSRSEGRY